MSVKEFRDLAAVKRQNDRERRSLLNEAWPVAPHWCAFCGKSVTRSEASAHHLVPREQGGSDRAANLAIVHLDRCHDRIELWTEKHGRPPRRDEWGRLSGESNLLVVGVGTRGEKREVIPGPPPLSTDDVPRYLKYLHEIDRQYQEQIAKDPEWGMWIYRTASVA